MKKAGDEKKFKQDDTGQWWWYSISKGKPYRLRVDVLKCNFCKEAFLIPIGRKRRKYCSRKCAGDAFNAKNPNFFKRENNGHWTGGRIKRRGYIHLHAPNHPACQGNTRKYVLEHRLVMEKYLGRYLKSYESIHHINGIKDDNRLENLELWTKIHPCGIRSKDIPHCPTCTCGKLMRK